MEGSRTWIVNKIKDLRRRPYGTNVPDSTLKRRAILKSGEYNIIRPKFSKRYVKYIKDPFVSLVDAEWKWTFQVLCIGFSGCWLTFALLWWLIAFVHTDLHENHLPHRQGEAGWTPCVLNIYGFPSAFLYSLETQHTTGYGSRAITEECPEAIFLMCAQCIIGMIIDSFTVGVVFAKLTRPKFNTSTVQFTKNAIIAIRDEEICLMFRVGDLRKSKLIGVSIKAILIRSIKTAEGETLKNFEEQLEIQCDDMGSDLFLLWPVTVIHKINGESPFYNFSAAEMLRQKFEIILILEGTVESTGQNVYARTSYLSNEILWGYTFANMINFNKKMQGYEVDYGNFDLVNKINDMPLESPRRIHKINSRNKQISIYDNYIKPLKKEHVEVKNNSLLKITCENQQGDETPPFPVWV